SEFLKQLLEKYPKGQKKWAVNPVADGPSNGPHAVRGGSIEDDAEDLTVTRRRKASKASKTLGFRCASWHVAGK
ncbi:MAG: hypothetical protein ACYTFG_19355, partial [Planctomycetota bacterium]